MMSSSLPADDYLALINDYIRQFPASHEGYLRRATFYLDRKGEDNYKRADEDIRQELVVSEQKEDAYYSAAKMLLQIDAIGITY